MAAQNPEVREALEELDRYLSDILPPLVVADSFQLLLRYPPDLTAAAIHSWAASQFRVGADITFSDYLDYAMRKVHLMWEFRLVPDRPFQAFLDAVKHHLIAYCPAEERAKFEENLAHLGEAMAAASSSVDALIRGRSLAAAGVPAAAASPPMSKQEILEMRRLSLLLERLQLELGGSRQSGDGDADVDTVEHKLVAQAIAAAARSSRDADEFEHYLDRLRSIGLEMDSADVFRALGDSLPGWTRPPRPEPQPAAQPPPPGAAAAPPPPVKESGPVEAMHKIVTQPEDPARVAERFHEMVGTAVDRFNAGSLPQAVTMLELAERIIAEKAVDPATVEVARSKADEALDLERLRRYAEVPSAHALLRRVLAFFQALSPKGLLDELLRELKRERRRLLLLLLEVHGVPAREAAFDRLQPAFGQGVGDEKWYFRRNLLYLLRRIPGSPSAATDEDVDIAVRHAVLKFPAPLVKEAVANLSQLKHEKAENTLIQLLNDLERMLLVPGDSPYDPRELRLLLDRVVAALARFGTAKTRRAVVDHAFRKKPELGDTFARLSELAGQDMSGDGEVVDRLLDAFKANSPHKVFGLVLHPNDQQLKQIIEALSGTRSLSVKKNFEGLVNRFPALEVSKAAARALASLEGKPQIPEAPFDTRSGDLEQFGLPALVQNLADSRVTGVLALREPAGSTFATLRFKNGKVRECATGSLSGEEAFFQLLERPRPAAFLFTRESSAEPGAGGKESPSFDALSLCLEGMRRYDEFQQSSAIVPDKAAFKAGAAKPTAYPEESDGIFVNELWKQASSGGTPAECEAAVTADAYRVRRQLAHWVESGALISA